MDSLKDHRSDLSKDHQLDPSKDRSLGLPWDLRMEATSVSASVVGWVPCSAVWMDLVTGTVLVQASCYR